MGGLLESRGIPFTVLDLVNMRGHYNPFAYLRRDSDALRLVTNLVANTTPKGAKNSDPFWDRAETALLQALILYLKHRAPVCEQNFTMVMEMINAAEVREGDPNFKSALDLLFDELESEDPQSIALKQYKVFKQAQDKTAKSILIGAGGPACGLQSAGAGPRHRQRRDVYWAAGGGKARDFLRDTG